MKLGKEHNCGNQRWRSRLAAWAMSHRRRPQAIWWARAARNTLQPIPLAGLGAVECRRTRSRWWPEQSGVDNADGCTMGQPNPQVKPGGHLNSGQYTVFAPTNAAFSKLSYPRSTSFKTTRHC